MDEYVPDIAMRKAVITVNMIENLITYLIADGIADKHTLRDLSVALDQAERTLRDIKG